MTTQEIIKREQADAVSSGSENKKYYQPATDVRETADQVILTFDMPGVSRDNVDLTVEKGTLIITGNADPEEYGTAVYRETHIGDYRRTFSLSEHVNSDKISAKMKDGVLKVLVPKPEESKPRRIAITSA